MKRFLVKPMTSLAFLMLVSSCGGSSNTAPTTTSATSLAPTTVATTLPATTTTTTNTTKPPVTTKAPTTTAKPKSSNTAKLTDAQISSIWSSLTTASRQFFKLADLKILSDAALAVKSKYAYYNTRALLGTSGDNISWTLKSNDYVECRVVIDNVDPIQLEPGC